MAEQNILPRFEVEVLEGEVPAFVYTKTEHGLEKVEVMEPAGWMVYFPAGHSIRVRTEKMLRFLGFHRIPGVAMMNEGEQTEDRDPDEPRSLKSLVQSKTRGRTRGASQEE